MCSKQSPAIKASAVHWRILSDHVVDRCLPRRIVTSAVLDTAAALLYASARASAVARSSGVRAGDEFTASASITAPLTVAIFARSGFVPFVSIWMARAASL